MEKLCIPLVREENVTNVREGGREGGEGKGASSLFVCGFDAAAALALAPSPILLFYLKRIFLFVKGVWFPRCVSLVAPPLQQVLGSSAQGTYLSMTFGR